MVRESWLWAVSQLGRSRLAARVGTGVQPLQGEIYMYSRVLGHVHPHSSVTSSSLVLLDFYLPLAHFPPVESDEVTSKRVLIPTWVGFGMHMLRCLDEVYVCIPAYCLHRKPHS